MKKTFLRFAALVVAAAAVLACNKGLDPDEPALPDEYADVHPLLPAHEMRGVWIATVSGIDWPQAKYDESSQKALYIKFLDHFKSLNINAVFFQVRPTADAFYDSPYEPWCKYITGTAGKAPSYDILPWLINEAHKRGMEFHAWINPYRIATRSSASAAFPTLDSRIPSEWTKDYQKIRVYNPALPEVRERIADIVRGLITGFDIDGIHMDDYFYPSLQSGEDMADSEEFAKYGSGFSNIKDWRRDNVLKMVDAIHSTVLSSRPEVTFTISPQGNYDNNYNTQYIDIPTICAKGLIDIVIPQLYWSTTASKDYFTPRLDWFSTHISNTSMMVGYAAYRFDGTTAGFTSSSELDTELTLASKKSNVVGGIYYNARSVLANPVGINDVMLQHYSSPALIPCVRAGAAPLSKAAVEVSLDRKGCLTWSPVEGADYYAVYRANGDRKVGTLIGTSKTESYQLPESGKGKGYFVTALTAFNAEGPASKVVGY